MWNVDDYVDSEHHREVLAEGLEDAMRMFSLKLAKQFPLLKRVHQTVRFIYYDGGAWEYVFDVSRSGAGEIVLSLQGDPEGGYEGDEED